jgi:hypothetical protein
VPVDLASASLDAAGQEDYALFVEPTEATYAKLREIGAEAAMSQ